VNSSFDVKERESERVIERERQRERERQEVEQRDGAKMLQTFFSTRFEFLPHLCVFAVVRGFSSQLFPVHFCIFHNFLMVTDFLLRDFPKGKFLFRLLN
jgi:hypothetical protein